MMTASTKYFLITKFMTHCIASDLDLLVKFENKLLGGSGGNCVRKFPPVTDFIFVHRVWSELCVIVEYFANVSECVSD